LDSDQCDSRTLLAYAMFLATSGQNKQLSVLFLVLRAVLANHQCEEGNTLLLQGLKVLKNYFFWHFLTFFFFFLKELNLNKEISLFTLWAKSN
jgi:hypothetical protein